MTTTIYKKLVRTHIPLIIRQNGSTPIYETLKSTEDILPLLKKKIIEEATELVKAESRDEQLQELADIYECLNTYLTLSQYSMDEVQAVIKAKKIMRGGLLNTYKQATYLKEVRNED